MSKIIICRGIPGSGKSTWAREWVLKRPEYRVRINMDDIRNMLGKYWVPSREKLVATIKNDLLDRVMESGYDIVVDNMNLNPAEIRLIESRVLEHNHYVVDAQNGSNEYEIEFKDFKTPVDVCVERDAKRENPIGESVIRGIAEKYKEFYNEGNQ